jgi:hypothetical protein
MRAVGSGLWISSAPLQPVCIGGWQNDLCLSAPPTFSHPPSATTVTRTACACHSCAAHASCAGATSTAPPATPPTPTDIVSAAVGASAPRETLNTAAAPDRLALTAPASAVMDRAAAHRSVAPAPPAAEYPAAHAHAAAAAEPAGAAALGGQGAQEVAPGAEA